MGPLSTGIGQGAAQVFNNDRTMNMYYQMMQQNQVRQQKETLAAQDMLKDYDPNKTGVRTPDMPKYAEKYNELKNLYIQNKKLYTNPAANIEAYKKAEALKNDLRRMATESKEYHQFFGKAGDLFMKDKDSLESGAMENILSTKDMAIEDIKAKFNGRLPNEGDIRYKPKPIDANKYVKAIHEIADAGNGYDMFDSVTKDGKGYETFRQDKVYRPEAIEHAYTLVANADENIRKNYKANFSKADPKMIEQLQATLQQKLGDRAWKIQDADSFAIADFYLNYGNVRGKSESRIDKEYQRAEEERRDKRNFSQQLEIQSRGFKNSLLLKQTKGASSKSEDDKLMEDSEQIIQDIKAGGHDSPTVKKALSKLSLSADVQVVGRTDYKAETLKKNIEHWNSKAGASGYSIDLEKPGALDKIRQSGLIVVKRKGKEGKEVVYLIDPNEVDAGTKLYNLYKANKEKPKEGVMKSIDDEEE